MAYHCYVFENEHDVVESIEHYAQLGGDKNEIKVLIKDVSYGQSLSASGLHHIDYLNEITAANHIEADLQHQTNQPRIFVGVTTGQFTSGVVSGSFGDDQTNAMEALDAYGLSEHRAADALKALRTGSLLVFVPEEQIDYRSHRLHDTMSAAFGENNNSDSSTERFFSKAAYSI